jgi:hypothetical protein
MQGSNRSVYIDMDRQQAEDEASYTAKSIIILIETRTLPYFQRSNLKRILILLSPSSILAIFPVDVPHRLNY